MNDGDDLNFLLKKKFAAPFFFKHQFFFIHLLARLLILIKKGGLLQLKFGVVGVSVGVSVNIYLWAR